MASGSLPPGIPGDLYARLAENAETIKAQLIIDTSGRTLKSIYNSRLYLLKLNAREFHEFVGRDAGEINAKMKIAREFILKSKIERLVVSMGSRGAIFADKRKCLHIKAPKVKVKSKIGAGDSMLAGIVYELSKGSRIEEAVRFGVAAGTAAVITPGTGLCKKKDAIKLYKQIQKVLSCKK